MTGVILCGGQSSRMGMDKGLLPTQSSNWAELAASKMKELQLPVIYSVNKDQYIDYSQVFNEADLIVDNPALEIRGPLLGLLSVHIQYPAEDLLVLACDMPLMEATLLQALIASRYNYKADAYVYNNGGDFEPLCGIYSSAILEQTTRKLQEGKLQRHSMKHLLEQAIVFSLLATGEQIKCFSNFNAHADLNGL